MSCRAESDAGRLFRSLGTRLARLARRHGVPTSECDDCVQEALLAWLTRYPDWALGDPNMRKWLHVVVVNHARYYYRRLKRRRTQNVDDMDSVPIVPPLARDGTGNRPG